MISWKELLQEEIQNKKDASKIVHCTISDKELLVKFDDGYGIVEGKGFRLYTENRIYFPVCYDGAEWIDSIPRDHKSEEQGIHFGGG